MDGKKILHDTVSNVSFYLVVSIVLALLFVFFQCCAILTQETTYSNEWLTKPHYVKPMYSEMALGVVEGRS